MLLLGRVPPRAHPGRRRRRAPHHTRTATATTSTATSSTITTRTTATSTVTTNTPLTTTSATTSILVAAAAVRIEDAARLLLVHVVQHSVGRGALKNAPVTLESMRIEPRAWRIELRGLRIGNVCHRA